MVRGTFRAFRLAFPLLFLSLAFSFGAVSLRPAEDAVSPCARCALSDGAEWCPLDMTCHAAGACVCETSCLRFTDCFTRETVCADCVNSGGVFCAARSDTEQRCFFPDVPNAAPDAPPQCNARCSDAKQCIREIGGCKVKRDVLLIGWVTANVMVAAGIVGISGVILYRGIAKKRRVAQRDLGAIPNGLDNEE